MFDNTELVPVQPNSEQHSQQDIFNRKQHTVPGWREFRGYTNQKSAVSVQGPSDGAGLRRDQLYRAQLSQRTLQVVILRSASFLGDRLHDRR